MTIVSELHRILAQTPASYPVLVTQEGVSHEIQAVEFGHNPPNLTIKLKPVGDVRTHLICQLHAVLHTAGAPDFSNGEHAAEWAAEVKRRMELNLDAMGITLLPEPEATIEELLKQSEHAEIVVTPQVAATIELATNHDGTPVPPAGPSDNPAAMAKALGDDAVLPVVGEMPAPMTPQDVELSAANYKMQVHEEPPVAPTISEQVIAAAKAKRTRKPKTT